MTDIEIKEIADSFMKIEDSLHEIMALSIYEVLTLAKDIDDVGFDLDSYCKEVLILRSCKSIEEIESEVRKWIEADGMLKKS